MTDPLALPHPATDAAEAEAPHGSGAAARPPAGVGGVSVPLAPRDLALATLLAAAALALYAATFQVRQYGDSSLLVQEFAAHPDGSGFWYHALYMPAAGLLGALLGRPAPPEVLRLLSSASGAFAVACAYLLARQWRAGRPASAFAAGAFALCPGLWFFATQIEVHTLHVACAGLCALVALAAPWRRPLLASACVALTLPLLFLSHQSGVLLGPGFLALSQHARISRGLAPFRMRTLLLALGPAYAAALALALPLSAWMGGRSLGALLAGTEVSLGEFMVGASPANVWEGWIQPLGLLLPLAVAGACAGRLRGWARSTPLWLSLPSLLFFVAWGLPERGGYALPTALYLAPFVGAALERAGRNGAALGFAVLLAQVALGWSSLRDFDAPEIRRDILARKAALAAALGERGAVISINARFQYIEAELPDVVEVSLCAELVQTLGRGGSPDEFVAAASPRLEPLLARADLALVFDRGHLELMRRVQPAALAHAEALEAWLRARCALVPVERTDWPLLRVVRAPPGG